MKDFFLILRISRLVHIETNKIEKKLNLNGEKTNYFDINYLLRGMIVPKGNHLIEFHFLPKIVKTGINIRIITIIITFSIIALMLYRKNKWV